ncbi:hypothetical protein WA026_005295 [Henosepilachna vigintioctopunctata]|uniref:Uncharacterized protein n=1 Tax=Henosepilachna vigintioctopunctata TaxID=420089 RepID=A0AAW1UWM0_9CUCU
MGVLLIWTALMTAVSVRAITVHDNYPQLLVSPTQNPYGTQKGIQINYDDPQARELQPSGYYQFSKNENVGSTLNINPNFDHKVYFLSNKNNPQFINVKNSNDESVSPNVHSEFGAKTVLLKPHMNTEENEKLLSKNCIPGGTPENSDCLEDPATFPFKKVTYLSSPDIEPPSEKLQGFNTDGNVEAAQKPGSHIWQKYLSVSPKYTLSNFANKPSEINLKLNRAGQRNNFEYLYSPSMKQLLIKAHQLNTNQGLNYMTNGIITGEDTKPQPSEKYEVYHENLPDAYHGNDEETMYHSYHPEVKKKRKEIHYHQHKHLHEHDHDQKHKHNHQSGHHHGHGHEHQNQHAHSHSHMNDHWHNHQEKDEHYHESDHKHGHQGHHEHKHHGDHVHKHHNDHHHGHEAHHDHDEDHWNEHSHKHHSDHSHRHGHKHNSKHSHSHKQNHGHKHHHKHHGKY